MKDSLRLPELWETIEKKKYRTRKKQFRPHEKRAFKTFYILFYFANLQTYFSSSSQPRYQGRTREMISFMWYINFKWPNHQQHNTQTKQLHTHIQNWHKIKQWKQQRADAQSERVCFGRSLSLRAMWERSYRYRRERERRMEKTLSRRVAFKNEILSERDYFKFFSFKGEWFFFWQFLG